MLRSDPRLPPARYFSLTWGITDQHGGMTTAMLRRSRSFRLLGGVDVGILTLDDRPDYPELDARLRASGELIEGLRIRNLWDELRERLPAPRGATPQVPELLTPSEDDVVTTHGGVVLSRSRAGSDGRFMVDRFRRDGSLLATERPGAERKIVLYSIDGSPLRSWKTSWGLYRWWFDRLTAGKPSFLIVDSKTAARSVAGYHRDHVTTIHIVHASHRRGGRAGEFRATREYVMRRAADFDEIVVLTPRQKADLRADLAAAGVEARIRTIPNGVDLPSMTVEGREPGHGVVVAGLHARKRLTHAVEAVAAAHSADSRVDVDIFGEGPREAVIRRRIRRLGAEAHIRLRGHDPAARTAFRSAGFSLLTSTSEGLPLVLVESMAAGCIPIAYDVRYGPADMIRDGVDGFLIPEGDVDAMAQRIVELQTMPAARLAEMRRQAVIRAAEFSDRAVTRLWSRDLRAAFDAKMLAAARDQPLAVRLRRRAGVIRRAVLWRFGR
ncbi:glycosyltransferase [Microbacterium sp. SA39]|uniref:glycosyltransferase n=1 Tax=Microbacterium sp. SA39 TaxID=1263625 RepID=UPI0005F9D6F0|nr:glycosyltransferase [Microbacterium sp. SA39]KJQ55778.1 putative poly(glycerol-phosphate) alpha-glucosyltransferase [Microbacterium sp. SA39]